MGLLDRWFRTFEPGQPQVGPVPLMVLRADGQRLDLTSRATGTLLVAQRQSWQTDAWDYRDMIGELRHAHQLLARSVAQSRFFAAEFRAHPDDPAELSGKDHDVDKKLAADAVANLDRLPLDADPDGFLAALTENLSTPGECFIHGQPAGSGEQWSVRSVSEITSSGDQIILTELPNTMQGHRVIGQTEELLRCWIRHPRWGQLADSPLRAMLDVLEEVVLTGREIRAASRSRIASNGLLLLPSEIKMLRERQADEEGREESVESDNFMSYFTQAITNPIRDEGHAGSVAPILLRGMAEHLKEVRHISMQREENEKIVDRQEAAIRRMLRGLDIQPEQVQGLAETNHWTAWQIEAADVKHQVNPMCAVVAGCLTKAFLRPALEVMGHSADKVRRVGVWYDTSELVENPNKGEDARDAHDRIVIKDETLRRALGFGEEDAPDDAEVQRRLAAKATLDPAVAALVLDLGRALREAQAAQPVVVDAQRTDRQLPAGNDGAQPAKPGQTVPERRTPAAPTRMVAAATPEPADDDPLSGWRVDLDAARELTAIDVALTERLTVAADAAIARVLERAGNRLRTKARADKALAASLETLDAHLVAAVIGRDRAEQLAPIADLLADAHTRVRQQARTWLGDAARRVADVVLRLLGLRRNTNRGQQVHTAIVSRLGEHHEAAITELVAAMERAASEALFRPDPFDVDSPPVGQDSGEGVGTLIDPVEVIRVVQTAGGGQLPEAAAGGGVAAGPVVAEVLDAEGAVILGYEWQYRPEIPRNTFTPHAQLDGLRVKTMTDPKLDTVKETRWLGEYYHPQDHKGCRCRTVPIWAAPEPGPGLERLDPARLDSDIRSLAEGDDRARRRGTSAQNTREARDRLAAAYIDRSGT